eukprot:930651-Rhodomonas_salina.1
MARVWAGRYARPVPHTRTQIRCEIKCKKTQSPYTLYHKCALMYLITASDGSSGQNRGLRCLCSRAVKYLSGADARYQYRPHRISEISDSALVPDIAQWDRGCYLSTRNCIAGL